MRIYLSSIAPQIILDLFNIRGDLKLNVLQPFVFRNNQGIDATLWSAMKRSGFTSLDQSAAKLRWTVSLVMPPI